MCDNCIRSYVIQVFFSFEINICLESTFNMIVLHFVKKNMCTIHIHMQRVYKSIYLMVEKNNTNRVRLSFFGVKYFFVEMYS